jgi:hypothetical protein
MNKVKGSFRRDDGRLCYVQVGERALIDDLDYGVLVALVRTINPLRFSPEPRASVMWCFDDAPPDPLREAINAAGGIVLYNGGSMPPFARPRPLAELFGSAIVRLAYRISQARGVSFAPDALALMEEQCVAMANGGDDAYWRAVFAIAGFGGEALRCTNGGAWVRCDDAGPIPFAFVCKTAEGEAELYLASKAMKRIRDGEAESLLAFTAFARA